MRNTKSEVSPVRRRALAVLFATTTALATAAGAANASTPAKSGTGSWICDNQVCLRVLPTGSVTPDNSSGCSGSVCVTVVGNGSSGYSTSGQGYGFYGHIQVFGPGLQYTGGEAYNPAAAGSGHGDGTTCAVGWMAITGGGHTNVGEPCEHVSG